MSSYMEIDYEIEAAFDEYGEFPLHCAILLFDLLNLKGDVVIKNQYSIKKEKANIIQPLRENGLNNYYEWPKSPEGNYCIWIKESYSSNCALIDILNLQGIYLSYIAPTDSFEWEMFTKKWKDDVEYLLLTDQATFICNIIDMDKVLNLNFNVSFFSREKVVDIISRWEKEIGQMTQFSRVQRTVLSMRGKHGNKHYVRLCFS